MALYYNDYLGTEIAEEDVLRRVVVGALVVPKDGFAQQAVTEDLSHDLDEAHLSAVVAVILER